MIKTTEQIFDKCIKLGKASVDLGLDDNYKLENARELWKKEKWVSLEAIESICKNIENEIHVLENNHDGDKIPKQSAILLLKVIVKTLRGE